MPVRYVVHNRWALGDAVCLSAFVRDLDLVEPGGFRITVSGNYDKVFWRNNPHVHPKEEARGTTLHFNYMQGMGESRRGAKKHFLAWFHEEFRRTTGMTVPLTRPSGDIHLTEEERRPKVPGRYWVVVAGGKLDMTVKIWRTSRYQEVVDKLAARGVACVQAGGVFQKHTHPRLERCFSALGATQNERDFFSLIANAEGVVCGITAAMHIAACFDKPCVVVAGGREEPWWEEYSNSWGNFPAGCPPVLVPHKFLHSLGKLDCCRDSGCRKRRTVAIEESDRKTEEGRTKLCVTLSHEGGVPSPACTDMTTSDDVVRAVMSYYEDGVLPPPGDGPTSYSLPEIVPAPAPVPLSQPCDAFTALDHPAIGGRLTIFVLSWGDNLPLLRKCLSGILSSVPASRRDVRVALNQPGDASLRYANGLVGIGVTKVYVDDGLRRKYPAMREMFHDPDLPITTKYLVWFDDDASVVDRTWARQLGEAIAANHAADVRLYGAKYVHDIGSYARGGHNPKAWFEAGGWWRGKPMRVRGRETYTAAGTVISFVSGWFWALEVAAMREAKIPDERLSHNGGDCTIGEQLHQAGYKVKSFNEGKALVTCPPKDKGGRRGFSEAFPWADPATRSAHRPGS